MDALQTSYSETHAPYVEGMIANSEKSNIVSRVVETAAGIGFGKVAVRGTADNQIKVAEADAAYLGITVRDTTQLQDSYLQYGTAAVMTKGVIVVQASVAVAQGDAVHFVPATGVLTNVATGNTAIPGATWDSSTSGAGLAKLRLG